MSRRQGFTLVELLVSLALLAVLVVALLPAVVAARGAAMKVVCTGRLHDLAMATTMHRLEKGAYPVQPGAATNPAVTVSIGPLRLAIQPPRPTDMDPAFLNALQTYLPFPPVDAATVSPSNLPHVVQCPTVEDADDDERISPAELTFTRPTLYTGYAYCVRPKAALLVPAIKPLNSKRGTSATDFDRAVIWADDVHWSVPDYAWSYSHAKRNARRGPKRLTYADASGILGQHRAYSDGSVEWVHGADLGATVPHNGAAKDAALSVFDMFYFWF